MNSYDQLKMCNYVISPKNAVNTGVVGIVWGENIVEWGMGNCEGMKVLWVLGVES